MKSEIIFNVDTPTQFYVPQGTMLEVSGWAFSKTSTIAEILIRYSDKIEKASIGRIRLDVATAFPDFEEQAQRSGFYKIIPLSKEELLNGIRLKVEIRTGNERIVSNEIAVSPITEQVYSDFASIIRRTQGFCPCCASQTVFSARKHWLRDHYICSNCGSIPRERALFHILKKEYPNLLNLKIHECSPSNIQIERMKHYCQNYSYSFFYPDLQLGENLKTGGFNQNVEKQTFEDESFDIFLSQDVMEHIFNPQNAFKEIYRVLKPGGAHIFTTPLYPYRKTAARIRFEQGRYINIAPPIYHGDPTNSNGCLVTYDWGGDIAEYIEAVAPFKTKIFQFPHTKDNFEMGLEGDFLEVIVSRKIQKMVKESENNKL